MNSPAERIDVPRPVFGMVGLPQWVADLIAVMVVIGGAFAPREWGGNQLTSWGPVVALVLTLAAVIARSWWPRLAAAGVLSAALLGSILGGGLISAVVGSLIVLFTVGRRIDRRTTILVAIATICVLCAVSFMHPIPRWNDLGGLLQLTAFVGFAAAAGDASRSRREYIVAITERAQRAEESKEAEARRRVAEERVTIARDLHDVLAHQITVISLHANVAAQALPDRLDDVRRSHQIIQTSSREVLRELSLLLAVLRSGEMDTAPAPGLSDVPALVETFRERGLDVTVRTEGGAYSLEGSADIVGYRVLQEALTNAHKHGDDGEALLHIDYSAEGITLTVTNTSTRVTPDTAGHGLIGVRERLESVGGKLEAVERTGPVFRFTAWLPR